MTGHDGPASRTWILDAVRSDPGVNIAAVAAQVGLSWHTTAYHLRALGRAGLVIIDGQGRDRRLFPPSLSRRQIERLALLRPRLAREVCGLLAGSPGLAIHQLASQLGRSRKLVQRHVARLVEGGLLERHGAWRPVFQVKRTEARFVARLLAMADLPRQPDPARPSASPAVLTAVQSSLGGGPRFGTWEWRLEGDRVVMSDVAWELSGLPRQSSGTGQSLLGTVHPEDLPDFEEILAAAVTEGKPFDQTVRTKDGGAARVVRLRGKVTALDDGGRPLRFAGTVEEVSNGPAEDRPSPRSRAASRPSARAPGRALARAQTDRPGGADAR